MRLKPIQSLLLVLFGVCFLAATGWTVVTEVSQPWKRFQAELKSSEKRLLLKRRRELEKQKKKAAPAALKQLELQAGQIERQIKLNRNRSTKIDQVWIEELRRADRCQTCHGGVEKALFAQSSGVLAKHPADFLKTHPIKRFGCTLCHDGDGLGLTVAAGHGRAAHWNRPLLNGALVQSACRRCHTYSDQIPAHIAFPQSPVLSRGKNLYLAKGCRGCHELAGVARPASIAPVLSRVGEKVYGPWLARWLKRPKDYLPDTIMPFFDLPPEEIEALQAFLLHRQEKSPAAVMTAGPTDAAAGEKLFGQVGCLGCHKVAERGGTFGPDLTRVAEKIGSPWLVSWIKNPLAYDPETVMPDFRLEPAQRREIAAYVLTLGKKEAALAPASDPAMIETGRKYFSQRGCTGCHTMAGFALGFKKAPEHTGFGDKRVAELDFGSITDIPRTRAAWVLAKEKSPRIFSTETIRLIMPNFELSDAEAEALRVFVLSFTEPHLPVEYKKALWALDDPLLAGMRTVERFNCIGCHKMGLVRQQRELSQDIVDKYFWSAANYALEDISTGAKTRLRKGQEINDRQFDALVVQSPQIENQLYRHRWFLSFDMVDYLKLDMKFTHVAVAGMDEGQILAYYKDLNFGPPILNYEGIKVQPDWLFEFLKAPYPVRPLTKATMPTFNLTEDQIVALVGFFQARDEIRQNPYFPTPELQRAETETAERIFKVCLQCHYFDQERTQSKARFGNLKGPNLAEARRRLRPDYIKRWIKYPDLVIPGTQMKNFFYYFDIYARFEKLEKDETGFPDMAPEQKIDMMAQFLMNPFKGASLAAGR